MPKPEWPLAARRWWAAKSPAERRIVQLFALVVTAVVGWLVVWQPLTRDVASLRLERSRNGAAFVDAGRLAGEIAGLGRAGGVAAAGDPRTDAERVLAAQGLRAQASQLDVQDGRVRVVFAAIPFAKLVPALESLQRDARLRVVEATLTAHVDPGSVRAELALAR